MDATRRGARMVVAWLGSLAVLVAGMVAAPGLIDAPDPTRRALGVAVGTLAQVPWLLVAFVAGARSDEYAREGLYLTTAVAMALAVVVLTAADLLGASGILPWGTLPPAWQLLVLSWAVALPIVRVARRA